MSDDSLDLLYDLPLRGFFSQDQADDGYRYDENGRDGKYSVIGKSR
jgi:hypothetical protein